MKDAAVLTAKKVTNSNGAIWDKVNGVAQWVPAPSAT